MMEVTTNPFICVRFCRFCNNLRFFHLCFIFYMNVKIEIVRSHRPPFVFRSHLPIFRMCGGERRCRWYPVGESAGLQPRCSPACRSAHCDHGRRCTNPWYVGFRFVVSCWRFFFLDWCGKVRFARVD